MGPPSRLGNNSTDAKTRKDSIQTITKSIQAPAEYEVRGRGGGEPVGSPGGPAAASAVALLGVTGLIGQNS